MWGETRLQRRRHAVQFFSRKKTASHIGLIGDDENKPPGALKAVHNGRGFGKEFEFRQRPGRSERAVAGDEPIEDAVAVEKDGLTPRLQLLVSVRCSGSENAGCRLRCVSPSLATTFTPSGSRL